MESATPGHDGFRPPSSQLACRPQWTSTDIGMRERRIDRCAISVVRQQTWQGFIPFLRRRLSRAERLCTCLLSLLGVQCSERPGAVQGAGFGRRSELWTARTVLKHGDEGEGDSGIHCGQPESQFERTSTGGRYAWFLHRTAHAVRSSLFASATITTLWCVRASN